MDKEQALKGIQSNIRSGNKEMASSQIEGLASVYSDDPFTLLTCISLSKVIEDEDGASRLLRILLKTVEKGSAFEVAKGLRSMGYCEETLSVLTGVEDNDDILRVRAAALSDMGRPVDAIVISEKIKDRSISDDIFEAESLCSVKEYEKAVRIAKRILSESSEFSVKRCYCHVLISSGDRKGADRFVKDEMKKDKNSADNNALAAYQMWIEGKTTPAAAYATKAIKSDEGHIGAMEVLAYCLAEKGKIAEARIVAGAINEREPGHQAVIRILDLCKND
jgi:Predicted N-acetylglucosaminyl transferase